MGEDKALLRLVPGGPTMLECVLGVANQLSSDVFVVAPADRGYARFGVRAVPDRFPGEGPLGGIVTALSMASGEYALVLSCDHPLLSVPLLRWISDLPTAQLVLPVIDQAAEGRRFPLLARYRTNVRALLASRFADGERRVQCAIGDLDTRAVGARELVRFDPQLRSFWNVNTPADAEAARRWLETDQASRKLSRQ